MLKDDVFRQPDDPRTGKKPMTRRYIAKAGNKEYKPDRSLPGKTKNYQEPTKNIDI